MGEMEAVKAKEEYSYKSKSQGGAVSLHLVFSLSSKATDLPLIFIRSIILCFNLHASYLEVLQKSKIRFKDQMFILQDALLNLIASI